MGIPAALLAIAIAIAVTWWAQAWMLGYAARVVERSASSDAPLKIHGLALQRAAIDSQDELSLYGSSELFCCGAPYRATDMFGSEPTGFWPFAVGRGGVGDLYFALALGALGRDLRGKKVVIIDSPPWFFDGLTPKEYAGTFSPLIAETFLFTAPISLRLREEGARQMLHYPSTMSDPLLGAAARALANPTPLHLLAYYAMVPLGRFQVFVDRVRDASQTHQWMSGHKKLQVPPRRGARLAWRTLAVRGTRAAVRRDTSNPFGFPNWMYRRNLRKGKIQDALARYRAGAKVTDDVTNQLDVMDQCWEWDALDLLLGVLHEVGAEPLVVSIPMNGAYGDYMAFPAVVRQAFYDRWESVLKASRFPWLDFREADEDRYFLTDPGAHFSSRGYVFANLAFDMYWHGRPIEDIRAALTTLHAEVPPPETIVAPDGRDLRHRITTR